MTASVADLILVRHGVTGWNREHRFQGGIDIPLADDGHEQARRAAQRLATEAPRRAPPIRALYSSPLSRAMQTAEPIARALDLAIGHDEGVHERRYGAFEGLTHVELQRDMADDFARWRAREPDFVLPGGGESLRGFHQRVDEALRRIAARHAGEAVVIVTHGGVLDCAYRIATDFPLSEPRKHELLNASLNTLRWDGERFTLLGWGDVAHLADVGVDDASAGWR